MFTARTRTLLASVVACTTLALTGCGSSSGRSASTTTTAPGKSFQVVTPDGQVSLSLTGKLPPNWPSGFPVPEGASPAGSGSLGPADSVTKVAVYTTSASAADTFSYYTSNTGLTTSGGKSVGSGASFVGSARITAPYTGSVTVVGRNSTTYIVVVLTGSSTTTTT